MPSLKRDEKRIRTLETELELSRQRSNWFQESANLYGRMAEILCKRFNVSDELRDEIRREANET